MTSRRMSLRQWAGWIGLTVVLILATAAAVWRGDILKAGLDPQVPFQTYTPPPAPDYRDPAAWALRDVRGPDSGPAAIFFVHSTTYDGGREWNGPIGHAAADAWLKRVVLPNYAGPFARSGAISAPRYRQSSLYTRLTLREDAREARAFAWRDIAAAFDTWIARHPDGPIVLAGVEQGGDLVERLVRERVAGDPGLRSRLVAVYLMDTIVAADGLSPRFLVAAAMLYGHLRFATLLTPRVVATASALVASTLIGLSAFTGYVEGLEFNDDLPYPGELKPAAFRLAKSRTPAQFAEDAKELKRVLDSGALD